MSLLDCAERCERLLRSLPARDSELGRTIVFAIASMQVAATSAILESETRADALRLALQNAREAREALDRNDLDQELIRQCAATCERAATLCAAALAAAST